jgi:Fur family transcriptional regulator, peroxide stress response regulator
MQKYKEIGLKLTPQRLSIISFLENNISHPTAEDVYRHVSKRFPTMSLATVYNTLETLKAKGRLSEITIDADRRHFDPDTRLHHHAICTGCRKIIDVTCDFDLSVSEKELPGFQITGSHVAFYGLCPDCKIRPPEERK